MSGGGVAAIVIVSLLLVGGSVAGYFVYKKKDIIRWRQFSYARQGRDDMQCCREISRHEHCGSPEFAAIINDKCAIRFVGNIGIIVLNFRHKTGQKIGQIFGPTLFSTGALRV